MHIYLHELQATRAANCTVVVTGVALRECERGGEGRKGGYCVRVYVCQCMCVQVCNAYAPTTHTHTT